MALLGGAIYIGGLSYSGKTQLRQIIGAHPALSMTRRTYMWERFYGRFGDLREPRNTSRCLAVMCSDAHIRRLEPDRARLEREFEALPQTYANLFALFHSHHAERVGARRWGDQLGFVERYAGPIFHSDPGARMVHMIREPHDRLRAVRRAYPGQVGWETARWLRSVELATRNEARYPGRYLVLRYEELAGRTRSTVARVCDLIGEECSPEMEDAMGGVVFGEPCRSNDRVRTYEWAGGPVNRVGMAAWRVLKDRPLSKRAGS